MAKGKSKASTHFLGEYPPAYATVRDFYESVVVAAKMELWQGAQLKTSPVARRLLAEVRIRLELCRRVIQDLEHRHDKGNSGGPEVALGTVFLGMALREVCGHLVELYSLSEAPVGVALLLQQEIWMMTVNGGGLPGWRAQAAQRLLEAEPSLNLSPFETTCRDVIAPREAQADAQGVLDPETWSALVNSGFLGLFHAAEWGGSAADGATQAHAMKVLARASPSAMWVASISSVLVGKILTELATPLHQERWLKQLISGEKTGCFAASEQGAGSDPRSYRTTLTRAPGGYYLHGEKCRVSLAPTADVAVVLCLTREQVGNQLLDLGQSYAVIDLNQPGISRGIHPKNGLRAMPWGSLRFDGVWVPDEDVLLNTDMSKTLKVVEWGQLFQSLCALGIAEEAQAQALAWTRARPAFGVTLADLPTISEVWVNAAAKIYAAQLLCQEVADRKARGDGGGPELLMAKIYTTELATEITADAVRLHGGWGFSAELPVERLHRDSLGNVPAGLPTDRLRELLVCPQLEVDPWVYPPRERGPSALN